jgi:hypothetical protein
MQAVECRTCRKRIERPGVAWCYRCGHRLRPAADSPIPAAAPPGPAPTAAAAAPTAADIDRLLARVPAAARDRILTEFADRIRRRKADLAAAGAAVAPAPVAPAPIALAPSVDRGHLIDLVAEGAGGGPAVAVARAPYAARAGPGDDPLADWHAQKAVERRGYAAAAAAAAGLLVAAHVAVVPVGWVPFVRLGGSAGVAAFRPATPGAWAGEVAASALLLAFAAALSRGLPDVLEGACLAAAGPCVVPRRYWFRYACAKGMLVAGLLVAAALCMGFGRRGWTV